MTTKNVAEAIPQMERRQDEAAGDLARLLPDDVLADVLSRLPPRGLAASRCVCAAWRAVIDGRRLLHVELLPRSLAGLLIKYRMQRWYPCLFARRPSAELLLTGRRALYGILDHCNGLLLRADDTVLNPATGHCSPLPKCPPPPHPEMDQYFQEMYLVFDPAVSPHYEVFSIPRVPEESVDDEIVRLRPDNNRWLPHCIPGLQELPFYSCEAVDDREPEWPPSPFVLNVFSSGTGRWEKRSFDRQGEAAGTVADMERSPKWVDKRYAVYWKGALYVHCEGDFVTRFSLSDNSYMVIKPPRGIETCQFPMLHLGKSEKGVYFAIRHADDRLWVWTLDESCDQKEWIPRHRSSAGFVLSILSCGQQDRRPCDDNESQKIQWDSDDDDGNIQQIEFSNGRYLGIIGFHPFKEIIFLLISWTRELFAYHLNSSKLEELGQFHQDDLYDPYTDIEICFPYTPCCLGIGEFSGNSKV